MSPAVQRPVRLDLDFWAGELLGPYQSIYGFSYANDQLGRWQRRWERLHEHADWFDSILVSLFTPFFSLASARRLGIEQIMEHIAALQLLTSALYDEGVQPTGPVGLPPDPSFAHEMMTAVLNVTPQAIERAAELLAADATLENEYMQNAERFLKALSDYNGALSMTLGEIQEANRGMFDVPWLWELSSMDAWVLLTYMDEIK